MNNEDDPPIGVVAAVILMAGGRSAGRTGVERIRMNGTTDTGIDITERTTARGGSTGPAGPFDPLTEAPIDAGAVVEVRRRFDRAWARGFRVIDTDESGYQLRRESDGAVLPVRFPAADLRLARNVDHR